MTTPTLINLPPPPSDPVTPDMGPGTPNSGTTSLSALSTTAIKDGHQGQPRPHIRHAHHSSSASATSTSTLEAERADRISRLAGLERVATARAGGGIPQSSFSFAATYTPGYFDSSSGFRERSTVGSASATGSVGARTTWASGSDALDADKMSEDTDDGTSSVGNISEGDASLVAFGEGASTISGPISHHPSLNRMSSGGRPSLGVGSPSLSRASNSNPIASYQLGLDDSAPMPSSASREQMQDARMLDGITYDSDVVDTTVRTPRLATPFDQNHPIGPSAT